ncbi:hypothetical protein AU188_18190 [Mycobacterium sp. IS-3022]|nr:hypothetical protein AU188_18190 [Mycobacterium sp. IS-3022]
MVEFLVEGGDFGFDVLAYAEGSLSALRATCLSRAAMPVTEPPEAMVSCRCMPRRKLSAWGF